VTVVNSMLLGLAAVVFVALLVATIRIVPEYQRLVVFRLGRLLGARGPGLVLLIPLIDRGVRVDLRERFFDVPPQTCITQDNAPVAIDFLTYMRITDAVPSVVNVQRFEGAARGIAITTLRAVVGDMLLDEVLSKREAINQALRGKLDEVTNRWGIKVTAVEIREIIPPKEILEAMTRQMSAERSRRAMVTEADGTRQAAILQAEGQKQAAILQAEGARQAAVLRAEGQAQALDRVFAVARTVDSKTMSLQYLEVLRALGAAPATKLVVPIEFTNLLRPFVEHTREADGRAGSDDSTRPAPAAASARRSA
jgi:regulator of protease activity HflC (stomatin/prohibitin superfamily)